jgi:hypothetical protein
VFDETKSKQIEELGIRYETEKKEQALKLKEKDNALLREQNKAGQTQRNALMGGTALLLLLLTLIYNRYRLKRRSNQQLEAQQQKLQAQQRELQAPPNANQSEEPGLATAAGGKGTAAQRDSPPGEKQPASGHEPLELAGRFPEG